VKPLFLLAYLIVLTVSGTAQNAGPGLEDAYLIPQRVFVGDPGRLALPLGAALPGAGSVILDDPGELPRTSGLIITRVELENRGEARRLIVDFKAFTPGVIELPPIEIASLTFTGLTVQVASILEAEGSAFVLSEPASSLVIPGTMGIIYGTALGMIAVAAGCVLLLLRGGPAFRRWREALRRRYVLWSMRKVLRHLRAALDKGGQERAAGTLDRLSREFRTFLGLFTGMNCHAMTGEEFLSLPSLTSDSSGLFIRDFFRRCDALRFSGVKIERECAAAFLDQMRDFIGKMEKYKKPTDHGEPAGSMQAGKRTRTERAV
jgi:hypothetical protein